MRPRPPAPRSISLQDRDLALLRDLFESRIMTAAHMAAIHFEGNRETAKKRLQKLKAAGLIGERRRKASDPAVLSLAKSGFGVLRERGVLADYPAFSLPALERRARVSDLTIRHELEVMDVKAAFHAALRGSPNFSVAEFGTWPQLHQFTASPEGNGENVMVRPDGFIRIHENEADGGLSEHTYFLEVDRSTEALDTLAARAGCYLDYYKTGGFAAKQGAPRSALKDYPFRVLMVFKTAERRNNMAERLLQNQPPIFTQVCLSTLAEVCTDALAAVWITPLDYREATKGTPFDSAHRREQWGYQRQTAREVLVGQKTKKVSILANQT